MLTVLAWSLFLTLLLLVSSCDTQLQTWHRAILRAEVAHLEIYTWEATKHLLDHIWGKPSSVNLFLANDNISSPLLSLFWFLTTLLDQAQGIWNLM